MHSTMVAHHFALAILHFTGSVKTGCGFGGVAEGCGSIAFIIVDNEFAKFLW